jgi:xanthine dehydrogenase YagR molybdenum-binding subunit
MGIGMALLEHHTYDPQNGAPINSNLADYIMAVKADVPKLDVHFLDYPDKRINQLGARGIGEIGLAGIARRSRRRRITPPVFVCANCRSKSRTC